MQDAKAYGIMNHTVHGINHIVKQCGHGADDASIHARHRSYILAMLIPVRLPQFDRSRLHRSPLLRQACSSLKKAAIMLVTEDHAVV
jgi:hypothetical protein